MEQSMKNRSALLAALAVAAALQGSPAKKTVAVFLFSGQSNMVSMASVNDLSADEKKPADSVYINVNGDCDASKKGMWLTLGPGFGSQGVNFGSELLFGRTMTEQMPGLRIAIIKNSVSGSPLGKKEGWLSPRSNGGSGGTLYNNMMKHIKDAMSSITSVYDTSVYTPKWAGFVWLQGETDAMDQKLANVYEENLRNLVADIRDTLGVDDLPVIIPLITTNTIWTYSSQVRGADVTLLKTLENVDTMETKMFPTPDNMHYNAVGQRAIGTTVAKKWIAMDYSLDDVVAVARLPRPVASRELQCKSKGYTVDPAGRKMTGGVPFAFSVIVSGRRGRGQTLVARQHHYGEGGK